MLNISPKHATLLQCLAVLALSASAPATAAERQFKAHILVKDLRVLGTSTPGGPVNPPEPGTTTPTPTPATMVYQDASGKPLTTLAIPDTAVGSNSDPVTVVLKNTGTTSFVFGSPAFKVDAPFSVSSTTCAGELKPETTCSVSIRFSPTSAQSYSSAMTSIGPTAPAEAGPSLPLQSTGVMLGIAQLVISPSSDSVFVQKTNGVWFATGSNLVGQLGLGHANSQVTFAPAPALAGAVMVAPSGGATFAKWPDGTWKAAGLNSDGQLGIGSKFTQTSFVPVPGLTGAQRVIGANSTTWAQMADGRWAASGDNGYGQLGNGGTGDYVNFTVIPALNSATIVMPVSSGTFVKLSNGTWIGTGANIRGYLGLGHANQVNTFTTLPALAGALQVVSGSSRTFVETAPGTWKGVGENINGPLGIGNNVDQFNFVAIPGLNGASSVYTVGGHTHARWPDGSWKATGANSGGQLGIGVAPQQLSFVPVPLLQGASQMYKGNSEFTYVTFPNGTLGVFGSNYYGSLGVGDKLQRNTVVNVNP